MKSFTDLIIVILVFSMVTNDVFSLDGAVDWASRAIVGLLSPAEKPATPTPFNAPQTTEARTND